MKLFSITGYSFKYGRKFLFFQKAKSKQEIEEMSKLSTAVSVDQITELKTPTPKKYFA